MYRPCYSINENSELAVQLIKEFPLGLLISQTSGRVETNYLPFLIVEEQKEIFLLTHLAKANPQWRHFSSEVVVSFLGPNSYISPVIYMGKQNVPTWSYAAVEVRGVAEIISEGHGLRDILNKTVEFFETQNSTKWSNDLPVQLQKSLEAAIVGLKIRITHTEAKFKLSQNRNEEDYNAVLRYFKESQLQSDRVLYDWMLKSPR